MEEIGNTKKTWISVSEAASLTNQACRTIRQKCAAGKLETKVTTTSKGVKKYLVSLSCLPLEAQDKYRSENSKAAAREKLRDKKEWQRAIALERFEILAAWDEYAEQVQKGVSECAAEFAFKQMKSRAEKSDARVKRLSRTTLFRWKSVLKKDSVAALAPNWNPGRKPFQEDIFSGEAQAYAADLWLHQNQPHMKHCWYKVLDRARGDCWNVPSYSTAKRFFHSIPGPVRIKNRKGKKVFEDNLPMMNRDYSSIKPLELAESDHHQVDVAVEFPDGHIGFPWLTLWYDVRSRKPLGWALVSKPSGDSINVSLYELISKYGLVDSVHLDNGKDYRGKRFTGFRGRRVQWEEEHFILDYNKSYIEGLYGDLGIKVHWAIPYSAKSKVIERFFQSFEKEFGRWCRGYRGPNVTERPEKLKDDIRTGNVMTFSELKKAIEGYLTWYSQERQHTGDSMDSRTPDDVFYDGVKVKRAIREDELALLFSSYPTPKTVEKSGIYMFNDYYFNENIVFKYLGRRVLVRYAEDNIDKIYVFDLEGKYIGSADKDNKAKWGQDSEEFRKYNRRKKAIREATKEWEERHIGQRLPDIEREKLAAPAVEKKKTPSLIVKYLQTSYAAIVAEEKQRLENEEKRKKAAVKLADKFAFADTGVGSDADVDDEPRVGDKAHNFLNNYGRSKND